MPIEDELLTGSEEQQQGVKSNESGVETKTRTRYNSGIVIELSRKEE